jgi:hypothetical protein
MGSERNTVNLKQGHSHDCSDIHVGEQKIAVTIPQCSRMYLPNYTAPHPSTPQPQYSEFQPINNYDSHTGTPSGRPIYILLMAWVNRSRSSNTAVQQQEGRGRH